MTTMTTMTTTTTTTGKYEAALIVAKDAETISTELNALIVNASIQAIQDRGMFTIALSGGSIVGFLAALPKAFASKNINPQFHRWHVILADERCVPTTHDDSNMGALQKGFFSKLTTTCDTCSAIPQSQIHGINQEMLQESLSSLSSTAAALVAADYEQIVHSVIAKSGGKLDMAILGFGPDGHTCSLFPNHVLLKEEIKWVASLEDSPKPPPSRITLTFPMLNTKTRHVVFCGAGTSKAPILNEVFENVRVSTTTTTTTSSSSLTTTTTTCVATMKDPAPYPCGAVRPKDGILTWVVDVDAMEGILFLDS